MPFFTCHPFYFVLVEIEVESLETWTIIFYILLLIEFNKFAFLPLGHNLEIYPVNGSIKRISSQVTMMSDA